MTKKTSPIEVLVTIPFDSPLIEGIQEISPRLRVTVNHAEKAEDVPEALWARCEVLYTGDLLPEADAAPHLKWIQFHYAGIDHVGEASILSKPDLVVTTLSGAAASQAAEYALTMMLALGRQLPAMLRLQDEASWPKERWKTLSPRELRTSTVGIIGYGSIGRQIARLLREFGATVLATKADAMYPLDNGYTPEGMGDTEGDLVHRLYPGEALKSMVKDCDFVILTLPLCKQTRGLINTQVLEACKPTAYLIDLSRGGILDHTALIKALNEDKIAGAALDVFPEEPLPKKSPLWKSRKALITPHIAGISSYYNERAARLFTENLSRYVAELPLYNTYNVKRGY
jgi:phosphoglycerate dehydrogenase-like enzyme